MKENKIAIKKLDIQIGDKTITLTPEQAKELKSVLNEMFEEKVIHEHHHDHHRYWWNWPTYIATQPLPYQQWQVTCESTASGVSGVSGTTTGCNLANVIAFPG